MHYQVGTYYTSSSVLATDDDWVLKYQLLLNSSVTVSYMHVLVKAIIQKCILTGTQVYGLGAYQPTYTTPLPCDATACDT